MSEPSNPIAPLCMDASALASTLGVSLRTVRRLDEEGKLPQSVKIGGSRRWLAQEIESWLKAGAPSRRQRRSRS